MRRAVPGEPGDLLQRLPLRTGGKYLGHANLETTMIYAHVVKELWTSARGPLDIIQTRRAP
jgi:hypothetical protein